jgi:5-methylcytosine-specific restriction endonuclease McrA
MRRRGREHEDYRVWSWSDFMHIARRFDYRCAYCGTKPDGQLQPDHVIPISKGGPNAATNLLPACASCNASKCDHSLTEWSAKRERLGLSPRMTSWPPEDRRYWHLTHITLAA